MRATLLFSSTQTRRELKRSSFIILYIVLASRECLPILCVYTWMHGDFGTSLAKTNKAADVENKFKIYSTRHFPYWKTFYFPFRHTWIFQLNLYQCDVGEQREAPRVLDCSKIRNYTWERAWEQRDRRCAPAGGGDEWAEWEGSSTFRTMVLNKKWAVGGFGEDERWPGTGLSEKYAFSYFPHNFPARLVTASQ